jgi:ABC-type transport system involved in multi-copper enzyme maturation permease subunit
MISKAHQIMPFYIAICIIGLCFGGSIQDLSMNVLNHALPMSIMASCSSGLRFLAIGLLIGTIYAEKKLYMIATVLSILG